MCPPMSSALSLAPRSVNHWLPASSTRLLRAGLPDLGGEPLARLHPDVRPRDTLRPVVVSGELAKLPQLIDRTARLQCHGAGA